MLFSLQELGTFQIIYFLSLEKRIKKFIMEMFFNLLTAVPNYNEISSLLVTLPILIFTYDGFWDPVVISWIPPS